MSGIFKNEKEVILSICIPTINRPLELDDTLKSITSQRIFIDTNKVEIVISDNCSTIETYLTAEKYKSLFPGKITYSRNSENIHDKNFEKVLSLSKGKFLKLNNDTLNHTSNSLEKMVTLIEENLIDKPILFFSNGQLNKKIIWRGNGISNLIQNISYYSTWIASFGIWKEDFDNLSDFNRCSNLQLVQVDLLYRLVNIKEKFIIDDEILFELRGVSKKGGYDLISVFLDNYKSILREQVYSGHIENWLFKKELNKIIFNFITPWVAKILVNRNLYSFTLRRPVLRICKYYKYDIYHIVLFLICLTLKILRESLSKAKSEYFDKY